jgi:hypothetical protein
MAETQRFLENQLPRRKEVERRGRSSWASAADERTRPRVVEKCKKRVRNGGMEDLMRDTVMRQITDVHDPG